MRHSIIVSVAAVIIALCSVYGAYAAPTAEQLNLSRAFKLAAAAAPEQLRQAVKEGVNFKVEKHLMFDENDDLVLLGDEEDEFDVFDSATPLHIAASRNPNPESIRYLLSLGLDVNAEAAAGNSVQETPLTCAIRNKNNIQVINELLNAGADPDAWNSGDNYSAFHFVAAECRNYSYAKAVIDALIKAGGDINSHYRFSREEEKELREYEEPSGFHVEWSKDNPFGDAIYTLARVTRGNFLSSFTPLMYAVLHNNPDVVSIMLDAGADPRIKSLEGKTALDYALTLPKSSSLRKSSAFTRLQRMTRQKKSPPAR